MPDSSTPGTAVSSELDPALGLPIHADRERTILYIDERRLTQDCIGRELAAHLPELSVESARSARDLSPEDDVAQRVALTVLHTHMAPIDECGVADQLSCLGRIMPGVPLVLLSDTEVVENIINAFRLGIRGYIPTSLTMKDAAEAIRFVRVGGTFVPPSALSPASQPSAAEPPPAEPRTGLPAQFTPRQREVLARLWQGKPNKVIAYELDMCESTVKVHIRHIMKKLHARNRTQVVLLTRQPSHGQMALAAS